MDALTAAIVATALTSVCWYWLHRKWTANLDAEIQRGVESVRELEKMIHVKERDFLDERNKLGLAHSEALKQEKAQAYREGREAGLIESDKDHLIELVRLKSEHGTTIAAERENAANDARDKARQEFELQNKMFSVSIRPYVRIVKDKGFISDEFETQHGYQYQLLVNGIPAFSPHVIIESSERQRKVDDEKIKYLIEKATEATKVAANLYMGGSIQYIKYASELVERTDK